MMLKKIENMTQAEDAMLVASTMLEPDKERTAAADTLRTHGLPTRRVEAWHYTDLRNQLKVFPENTQSASKKQAEEWLAKCSEFLPALRLAFLNGQFLEGPAEVLPAGLNLQTGEAKGGYRDATDAVALINSMLAADGVKISIDADATIGELVELLHGVIGDSASACRHSIALGAGASANFIERHISENGQSAFSNTVTDLSLEKGANVRWIIVQEEGEHTNHLGQLNVTLGEDAQLEILVMNAGGQLVRREINVTVSGPNSDLSIRGVNLIGDGSHIDVTTSLFHEAPDTVSNEIFRNVATGTGKGVFQGEIRVAKDAQKTDARMACNTLLLSDEAEYSAKPELEIFADDVQCAHGATVTDILDDHLFYLRARGLSERDARALLVKAFVEEVFDEIEEDDLRDNLNARIENWLDNHG